MKQFINKLKSNIFFRTYILILLPVLIILIFSLFSTVSYNKKYKDVLKESYTSKLDSNYQNTENSLLGIAKMIRMLSENQQFMNSISNSNFILDQSSLYYNRNLLKQIKKGNSFIDNIVVVDKHNNAVYGTNISTSINSFFESEYNYKEYDLNFWNSYRSPLSEKKLLSPTTVSTHSEIKQIIPMVFTRIGNKNIVDNFIIVNIDLSYMLQSFSEAKLTDNTLFSIINKQTHESFGKIENENLIFDNNFYENLSKSASTTFDTSINKNKYLVVSFSPSYSILGYTYVALIPYSDINTNISNIMYTIILIGFLILFAVLFIAYFSTKRIYKPIEQLADIFPHNTQDSNFSKKSNPIEYLKSSIKDILNKNENLSQEMNSALPLIQERYLINFLNSNEHYIPKDAQEFFENNMVDLKYKYFCSIIIKLRPSDKFYELYNSIEYNTIQQGIYNIIQSNFSEFYNTYIIPSETDTLYVLLNLEEPDQSEKIKNILDNLTESLKFDEEYIKINIGLGNIYANLEGLKKSHHEATSSIVNIPGINQIRVQASGIDTTNSTYNFSINDENVIFNQLIAGKVTEATEFINKVVTTNIEKDISSSALMQLYVQIINIIFKVMRIKNISYDDNDAGDFNIISEIISHPLAEVHGNILKLMDIIKESAKNADKVDIQSVLGYIQTHYNEDIYLETLAEIFNTSPKYLSRKIKEKLGINFANYLANLRIDEAKTLLKTTDKTITEIYESIGYNNRNTFIRTFKDIVKITPSEYRKEEKEK